MVTEPVAPSNALFGVDGTELPRPLPVFNDPLTGLASDTWSSSAWLSSTSSTSSESNVSDLPPVPLPPVPDERELRAAMAALFGADPAFGVDPAADPVSDPGLVSDPDPDPSQAHQQVPAQRVPTEQTPAQTSAQRPAGPPVPDPMYPLGVLARPRPVTPQRGQPPLRRAAGQGPQVPSGPARMAPMVPAHLRRRLNLDRPAGELGRRSGGGVRAGCIIALVLFGIVALNIMVGFVEALSGLFQ